MIVQIVEQIVAYFFEHLPEWIFLIVSGFIAFSYKRILKNIKKDRAEDEALKEGVQALLRDRIIHSYNKYTELKYCPIYAKENVQRMYKPYHELGGNDIATDMVLEMEKLPTKELNL